MRLVQQALAEAQLTPAAISCIAFTKARLRELLGYNQLHIRFTSECHALRRAPLHCRRAPAWAAPWCRAPWWRAC